MRFARRVLDGLIVVAALLLLAMLLFPEQVAQAQRTVLNGFLPTTGTDNILEINGTLEFEDKVTVLDHYAQAVTGFARVTTNLSGGVTDCAAVLRTLTPSRLDPYTVTYVTTTGSANVDLYVWKVTSSSDTTLIQSTTASTVGLICAGAD